MFRKEDKAHYANLAWPELVLLAEQGRTIFYSDLGEIIGIDNDQEVSHALSPIQSYCRDPNNKVPHLTSLVVKKPPKGVVIKTPKPGGGYTPKLGTHKEDKDAVYDFNWEDHPNPGYDAFFEYADE